MNRIDLTGLKSGTPIGFMAALGTFRQAERIGELGGVKLAWIPHGGQWCAALHTEEAIDFEAFVKLLLERVKSLGKRREFEWSQAVKSVSREEFVRSAGAAIQEAFQDDHELADWFAAFGSELVLKDQKVESTPLDMSVARQKFLAKASLLSASLATPDRRLGDALNLASLQEVLAGPWRYRDSQHSQGWDPSTKLMGAFTPGDPSSMDKSGVRGAVWLAMESLPFFPCVYEGGRLGTRGFVRKGKGQSFVWPIWKEPLSGMTVRTLLSQVHDTNVREWKGRGVVAAYSSEVCKPNQYLTSFQAPELLG